MTCWFTSFIVSLCCPHCNPIQKQDRNSSHKKNKIEPYNMFHVFLLGVPFLYIFWLVVWNIFYFYIYWECHHPNWRTHIFQRGRYTINQLLVSSWVKPIERVKWTTVVPWNWKKWICPYPVYNPYYIIILNPIFDGNSHIFRYTTNQLWWLLFPRFQRGKSPTGPCCSRSRAAQRRSSSQQPWRRRRWGGFGPLENRRSMAIDG